jgi:hypothetical protein
VQTILQASEFLTKPVDFDPIKENSRSFPPRRTERGEGAVEEIDDPKPIAGGWT